MELSFVLTACCSLPSKISSLQHVSLREAAIGSLSPIPQPSNLTLSGSLSLKHDWGRSFTGCVMQTLHSPEVRDFRPMRPDEHPCSISRKMRRRGGSLRLRYFDGSRPIAVPKAPEAGR